MSVPHFCLPELSISACVELIMSHASPETSHKLLIIYISLYISDSSEEYSSHLSGISIPFFSECLFSMCCAFIDAPRLFTITTLRHDIYQGFGGDC
jgi:hypothetical protein